MENEEWRTVDGVEVSDLGRIRVGGRFKPLSATGKYARIGRGYLATKVGGKLLKVHRLVAMAFCSNPNGSQFVNHKNGQTFDNRACNLEWVTARENQRHAMDTGLWVALKGEAIGTAVLNCAAVIECRNRLDAGMTHRAAAKAFGISKTQVGRISRRESWTHV